MVYRKDGERDRQTDRADMQTDRERERDRDGKQCRVNSRNLSKPM